MPGDHPTIQAAISSAARADEIVVGPGTYFETIDLLGKAVTVRSSDGPLVTVINGSGAGSVVKCINGEGPGRVFEGFTITGGSVLEGGGMRNEGSSPTVIGCEFVGKTAVEMGGGMFNLRASPVVSSSRFDQNNANKGGGMRNYLNSHSTVSDSVFSYNQAGEEGGVIDNRKNSNPRVSRSLFIGNSAGFGGGGVHNYVGRATSIGNPIITNTTIVFNVGSGISSRDESKPIFANTIVWGNAEGSFSGKHKPLVTYSLVEGGFSGVGNIAADPLFVSTDGPDGDPATLGDNPRISAGTVDRAAYESVSSCVSDNDCDDGDPGTSDSCVADGCLNDPLVCDAGDVCSDGTCVVPLCDGDGLCESGEDCNNCLGDCMSGGGPQCGNGVCEAGAGEDCLSCAVDCNGVLKGKPSTRFCCGDGEGRGAVSCTDSRCSAAGWLCTETPTPSFCCGDGICEGEESAQLCGLDCAAP